MPLEDGLGPRSPLYLLDDAQQLLMLSSSGFVQPMSDQVVSRNNKHTYTFYQAEYVHADNRISPFSSTHASGAPHLFTLYV